MSPQLHYDMDDALGPAGDRPRCAGHRGHRSGRQFQRRPGPEGNSSASSRTTPSSARRRSATPIAGAGSASTLRQADHRDDPRLLRGRRVHAASGRLISRSPARARRSRCPRSTGHPAGRAGRQGGVGRGAAQARALLCLPRRSVRRRRGRRASAWSTTPCRTTRSRRRTVKLAEKLMKKSPAVLRATKAGRCARSARWISGQAYDYLAAKGQSIRWPTPRIPTTPGCASSSTRRATSPPSSRSSWGRCCPISGTRPRTKRGETEMKRLLSVTLAGAVAALVGLAGTAEAQFYKGKRITILINYSAGGPTDIEGRLVAKASEQAHPGQPPHHREERPGRGRHHRLQLHGRGRQAGRAVARDLHPAADLAGAPGPWAARRLRQIRLARRHRPPAGVLHPQGRGREQGRRPAEDQGVSRPPACGSRRRTTSGSAWRSTCWARTTNTSPATRASPRWSRA